MEPSTGKAKPGRTRAACIGCRSNKQRCDGAQRHPCRRCELYGIACEYEGGAPPKSAVQIDVHDPSRTGLNAAKIPAFVPPSATSQDQLQEILTRLRKIELGLEFDRKRSESQTSGTVVSPSPTSPHNPLDATPSSSTHYPAHSPTNLIDLPVESNPVQVISETIGRVEESAPGEARSSGSRSPPSITPEAITRGLVTLEDAHAAFVFFAERVQPHLNVLGGEPEDVDPLLVHSRSGVLFNTVLLVSNYYYTSTSPRAQEVYRGLTEIVNLQIAHSLLCPDPNQLNADLIRAIVILLFYKPVQYAAYNSRGVTDRSKIEHASKVNAFSSLMLHGMLHTVSRFIRLDEAPAEFLAAIAASTSSAAKPIPTRVVSNLRLHYLVLTADMHGSLQSGRPMATDPTDALKTTRQFANLGATPQDARRAAGVELYASVRTPPNANQPSKIRLAEIGRINDELDKWEHYWTPILINAQKTGKDKLAYTATCVILPFIKFTVNSATFTRWSLERKWSLEQGGSGRPTLSDADWVSIQSAADAAQQMLFSFSVEAASNALRTCEWPAQKVEGHRAPLELDLSVVADMKTSTDTFTSISFIWGVLLLVRLASAGLISCELECRRQEYDDGSLDLGVPQPLVQGRKLPRLLELTAKFLRALAPHSSHPAEKHSVLTEMILSAGLKEDTPHAAPPSKSALEQLTKPSIPPSVTIPNVLPPSNTSINFPTLAPSSGGTNSITIPATLDQFLWEGSAPGILPESNQPAPFDFLAMSGTSELPQSGNANPFAIPFEENTSAFGYWDGSQGAGNGAGMDWLGNEF